jgi:hypothetical protein
MFLTIRFLLIPLVVMVLVMFAALLLAVPQDALGFLPT